ncbi:DUF4190 domain-containing protein [Modestobacter sp. SSW1-42]|uniref:DUF4190 domain-containing protein n=1 Tax=Modestobacter sp. SSW1-42 TaxID=596372 RepID=UPI003988834F
MSPDDTRSPSPPWQAGPPPSWGPPPPGWGPSPASAWRRPTNQLAPIALVLCFLGVLAPVGLGLGIVARRQIRRTGEGGEGLALTAVVVGGVVSTLLLIGVVVWVVALTAIANGSLG